MLLENKDLTHFEGYVLDRSRWTLKREDETIALSRKSFDLLLFLIDHRDRVLNKEELLQALWPDQFVEESNLTQQIFLLRKALSQHESGAKIVETVPGRGYRFCAQVEEVPGSVAPVQNQLLISARESTTRITIAEEEIVTGEDDAPLAVAPPAPARKRGRFALGGLLLLALLAIAGWFGRQRWLDHSGGPPVQIVLTPLEGSTGDVVLDRSLSDALRMDLTQSPHVSVVSSSRMRATLSQMMRKPAEAIDAATAREICERTNSQAVLSGTIARPGKHFLLTLQATTCVDGSTLAEEKREADTADDLPRTIDLLSESIRQRLGESRRDIARFSVPLFATNTVSLEALKDYSQASQLTAQGKFPEAITLLKKAVTVDPQFAAGYYDLAAAYYSSGDNTNGRTFLLKAYDLRNSATEPIRFAIEALYTARISRDLYEAERSDRNWTQLYPRSAQAWNQLSAVQSDLGRHTDSVESGKRALALLPTNQGLYANLAWSQLNAGDLQGARATCDQAIAHGLDGEHIRTTYISLGVLLHDSSILQAQRAWAADHPDAFLLQTAEAQFAMGDGRFADAHKLVAQLVATLRRQGLPDEAESMSKEAGVNLIEAGDVAAGVQLFRSAPADPESYRDVVGLAEIGETAKSLSALQAMISRYPAGTLWNLYYGPRVRAAVALAEHKPGEAIAALEVARPLEARGLDIQKERADAYLADGKPALAEKEYRNILAHPELAPGLSDWPLSWLGLGRALAAEGNRSAAVDAYQHFFSAWAHADADAMYLQQAKREFETLQAGK